MPGTDDRSNAATFREVAPGSPEYHGAVRLREAILRLPLGLILTAEELAMEPECRHFIAVAGDEVIATLLLKPLDAQTVKMRQVAVEPSWQGRGVGARLVSFAEDAARASGFRRMIAHARGTAVPFYLRLRYTVEGEPFLEQTIAHQLVTKVLA